MKINELIARLRQGNRMYTWRTLADHEQPPTIDQPEGTIWLIAETQCIWSYELAEITSHYQVIGMLADAESVYIALVAHG